MTNFGEAQCLLPGSRRTGPGSFPVDISQQHQLFFNSMTMVKGYEEETSIAIDEFKKRMGRIALEDPYIDDKVLYRFLKARNFNIDNAERMLKKHLEERIKFDFENIFNWKRPEVLEKYFPLNIFCHDKEGSPVAYIPSGSIDWIVVLNAIYLLKLYLDNFPETMKKIYVINTSFYSHLLYSILHKFLPASFVDKIHIYSDESWKDEFVKIIDAEVLPAFLGGKKTDPDGNPLCLTFIRRGQPVPESFYIHRSKRSLAKIPGVQRLMCPRATFREIILEVKELDSYIEWEFETESRDIGFGLFREDDEGNKIEIIPLQRINTDDYSETGLYKCKDVGKHIVIFDNTYSIIRKKEIFYKIHVKKLDEEESELRQSDGQDV